MHQHFVEDLESSDGSLNFLVGGIADILFIQYKYSR